MSKKLLREYYELCDGGSCPDLLTEAEKKFVANGGIILSGKLQEADAKNGNGRVYPKNILEREMKNYKKLVSERRALGELDHPDDSVINLRNTSHVVTEVWWDKDNPNAVMGKIECLNTPSGKILQELARAGVKLGISSRGLGSVKEERGKTIVEDDFQLICFDMVSEPSTNDAFMIRENKLNKSNLFGKADRINRALNEVLREDNE
jgi:hypothetical protein|tara:strand:+ start:718 stop:1338 length:621 start_codon:yes stop_codon:yes gene_type:complete